MNISLSPINPAEGATDVRPQPIYLPTAENHDAYKTVMVERKVIVPPPPEPVKNAKTIELEVRKPLYCTKLELIHAVHTLCVV